MRPSSPRPLIRKANKAGLAGVPNLSFVNFSRMYEYPSYFWLAETWELLDNITVVKGSHKLGLLKHDDNGWFLGYCQEPTYWDDHPENVVPIMPKAGGISIHHALTLHASPK